MAKPRVAHELCAGLCDQTQFWRNLDEEQSFLALGQHRSLEDNPWLASVNALDPRKVQFELASHRLIAKAGRAFDEPDRSVLSYSTRFADPGYAKDLITELTQIFQSLEFIPGFHGWAITQNATLAEEISGLVWWADRTSFEASLPHVEFYEIMVYGGYSPEAPLKAATKRPARNRETGAAKPSSK